MTLGQLTDQPAHLSQVKSSLARIVAVADALSRAQNRKKRWEATMASYADGESDCRTGYLFATGVLAELQLELLRGLAAHFSDLGGAQVRGSRPEAGRHIVRDGCYVRIGIGSAEARHFGDSGRT